MGLGQWVQVAFRRHNVDQSRYQLADDRTVFSCLVNV